jgi:hypothetical protein
MNKTTTFKVKDTIDKMIKGGADVDDLKGLYDPNANDGNGGPSSNFKKIYEEYLNNNSRSASFIKWFENNKPPQYTMKQSKQLQEEQNLKRHEQLNKFAEEYGKKHNMSTAYTIREIYQPQTEANMAWRHYSNKKPWNTVINIKNTEIYKKWNDDFRKKNLEFMRLKKELADELYTVYKRELVADYVNNRGYTYDPVKDALYQKSESVWDTLKKAIYVPVLSEILDVTGISTIINTAVNSGEKLYNKASKGDIIGAIETGKELVKTGVNAFKMGKELPSKTNKKAIEIRDKVNKVKNNPLSVVGLGSNVCGKCGKIKKIMR